MTSKDRLKSQLETLKLRLLEAEEALSAIRNGQIDGLIVNDESGDHHYTLNPLEHPYRVLVEEMSEGASTFLKGNFINYSNSRFSQMLKSPLENVMGSCFLDYVHPSSRTATELLLDSAWRSGSCRGEILLSAGALYTYLSASLIHQQGTPALCVVLTDLSEQKKAEALARTAVKRTRLLKQSEKDRNQAEAANVSKSNFLANMSHEIRTPLGAIIGFAELMTDENQSVEDRKQCVETIIRNGNQLSQVINEILDLSKVESDKMDIEKNSFGLGSLISDVTSLLSVQAQFKGLTLSATIADRVPRDVTTDSMRLRQILINVVGNAIKFTEKGSVKIYVQFIQKSRTAGVLQILVKDTGIGLSDTQQKKLFTPFTQADPSTTRKFGGSGLGLALSRKLCQALGGDLTIHKSELGVGSIFKISIPLVQSMETEVDSAPVISNDGPVAYDLKGLKILLVDDAADNRTLVSRILTIAGASVDTAENGIEGIEKALKSNFNLVLMDIQMPLMDGFEAVRELRSQGFRKPIIALTAYAMKGDRERCLSAGFDNHLVKPIDRELLLKTVSILMPPKKSKRQTQHVFK